MARGEPGRFDDLLSAREVVRQLEEPGLRFPGFRLVKAGAKLDVGSYTKDLSWRPVPFTGTAEPGRVVAEFAAGATVVLQGLHLTRAPVADYCRRLEARLGHPVQLNAYFTPRRSQGLPHHHDTHDVFVLQVDGTKRWLVYEPVFELPLKHQRYDEEAMGPPGPVVLDVTLGPGDTLYLPRGWLHEALTSAEDSLHLTVGVNVYTWIDALRAAVDRLEADPELRRAVPADGEGADGLAARLAAELDPEPVARAKRHRLVRTRRPILPGQLAQLRGLDELAPDSRVERRPTVLAELEDDGEGVALAFEGRRIRFPRHAAQELEALVLATGPTVLAELPGDLDGQSRVVLARRLVREGFLRRVST